MAVIDGVSLPLDAPPANRESWSRSVPTGPWFDSAGSIEVVVIAARYQLRQLRLAIKCQGKAFHPTYWFGHNVRTVGKSEGNAGDRTA